MRRNIKYGGTVIEMASDAAFTNILTTATEAGCHLSTEVFGRAATQANVYVRARYEDAFTSTLSDGANSANLPITFSNWASDDIISIKADKVIARTGDFYIIFADKVGSRNFAQAGSQVAHTESTTWDSAALIGASLATSTQALTKNTGSDAWGTCYAKSTRAVHHGDCSISLTVVAGSYFIFGFAYGTGGTTFNDFEHGLECSATVGDLYWVEGAATGTIGGVGSGATQVGDTFTIQIVGSTVNYIRTRGGVSTTLVSRTATTKRPLRPCVSIYSNGTTVNAPTVTGVLAGATGEKAIWQNIVGMAFDSSDDITKTKAAGAYDSGASSQNGLAAGQDGRLTFIASQLSASHEQIAGWSITDADQNYTSILFAADCYNGTIYRIVSGVSTSTGVSYSLNDEISVGREGGVWIIRKNGVVAYTGATATTSALIVDTSFNFQSTLKTLRIFKCGALGQGYQLDTSGNVYASGTLYLGERGVSANEVVTRGVNAFDANGRYVGNDRAPFLPHKITAGVVQKYEVLDNGDVMTWLKLTFPGWQSDGYANGDSVRMINVKVYTKFNELLEEYNLPCTASGAIPPFAHSRDYADPKLEAVYELRITNGVGVSYPFWISQDVIYTGGTPPTYVNRLNCPTNLMCAPTLDYQVVLAWTVAVNGGTYDTFVRQRGDVSWTGNQSGLAVGTTLDNLWGGLAPDTWPDGHGRRDGLPLLALTATLTSSR